MKIEICAEPAYAMAYVYLEVGESFLCERGAMAAASLGIDVKGSMTGGPVRALMRRFTQESFFMSEYTGIAHDAWVALAPKYPGDIAEENIDQNRPLIVQSGSLLGYAATVVSNTKFNGAQAVLMREGLTATRLSGFGKALICTYGGLQKFRLPENGAINVDTGHLVAWSENTNLQLGLVGGIAASALTGEGLAAQITAVGGPADVFIQTRSEQGTRNWLNPARDHDTGGRK